MSKLTEVCMACGKVVGWGVLIDVGHIMACKECIEIGDCLLYTSPSPRDRTRSRMPSSA